MYELEKEMAAIARMALDSCKDLNPYYDLVPQDFSTPAIYFPPVEVKPGPDSFRTYKKSYSWIIKVFGQDDSQAFSKANKILDSVMSDRCNVPLYEKDGTKTSETVRVDPPELKHVDDCVYSLSFYWDIRRGYNVEDTTKVSTFIIEEWYNSDEIPDTGNGEA